MPRLLIPKLQRVSALGRYQVKKWIDPTSIYSRLPEFYKKQQIDFLNRMPQPVHYISNNMKYEVDHETGFKKRIQNVPITVLRPKQSYLGIWGGEGVIPGYRRPKQTGYTRPAYLMTKLWRPKLLKLIFYSEILDKYYALTCTRRTLALIEEAQGFDHYILKTHEVDLCSDIGMQLKREMLIKIAKKDSELWPNDAEKREVIYNRYKQYEIPAEQAEWVGLKPWEAMKKQLAIEKAQAQAAVRPHKEILREQLLASLEKLALEGKDVTAELPNVTTETKSIFRSMIKEWTGKK